ncbi:AI-2E family transporter [Catenulispora sp. NF23]|nr:AI-2E family transporter [Catenulispora pinistramenti]
MRTAANSVGTWLFEAKRLVRDFPARPRNARTSPVKTGTFGERSAGQPAPGIVGVDRGEVAGVGNGTNLTPGGGVAANGAPASPASADPRDRSLWLPGRFPRRPPRERSWVHVGFGLGIGLILAYATAEAILSSAQVLILVLLSAFIAVSLEPIVVGLMRLRLRRGAAVAVVLIGFAAVIGGFIALVIPPVSTEISALTKAIPQWLQELHDHNSQLGRIEDRYHIVAKARAQFVSGDAGGKVVSGLLAASQVIIGAVSGTLIVITLTTYFLIGMPAVRDFGLRFVMADDRPRAEDLTNRIVLQVGRYMLANLATSVLAGIATFVWCLAVGVPYAAVLGFLVAIMDLVPVIGSTVGGVVVSLVALSVSVPTAITSLVFYIVFRFAEDHLITPLTMKYTVRIHPVATMIAVLVLGTLLGLIGALIAVPTATAVGLILDEVVFPKRDQTGAVSGVLS